MKLYLKDYKKKRTVSVEQFLLNYYENVTNYAGTKATYMDIKCDKLQCTNAKTRSFTDIYYLTKTYFPRLTEATFTKSLVKVMRKKEFSLKFLFCNAAQKVVMHASFAKSNDKERNFFDKLVYDYSGSLYKQYNMKGNGDYSLLEVLQLAGFKKKIIDKEIARLILR